MKNYRIITLPGDGIGPEVVDAAMDVLKSVGEIYGLNIDIESRLIGGISYEAHQKPITNEVIDDCLNADAVFLGAVGGPLWDDLPHHLKPEKALLKLRKELGLFSNLRPAKVYDSLLDASSLKAGILKGADLIVVRELTGGIYFGEPRGQDSEKGWNTLIYKKEEVRRIAEVAFKLAENRGCHLTSVHKSNVLESSQFWKNTVDEVHRDFLNVRLDNMYVDNAAMQLIRDPNQFDVIVTQNLFGDILSDISAMITGSLGMLPSACIGRKHQMYEPVHGSAPDMTGKNIANPIASIASVAMMFEHTFKLPDVAKIIIDCIDITLENGFRTIEIADKNSKVLSTSAMTSKIIEQIITRTK